MSERKFGTVDELQKQIDVYFENRKFNDQVPTICGLALFLGFESRQSIYDYAKSGDFSYTIKRAVLKMVDVVEEGMLAGKITPTAAIFWLKNHGWKDKNEVEITGRYSLFEQTVEEKAKKYETVKRSKKKVKK